MEAGKMHAEKLQYLNFTPTYPQKQHANKTKFSFIRFKEI